MKKILLLISTILTISATAQRSGYYPFPDSNATWNLHYLFYCMSGGITDEQYSITMSGDTAINSLVYHKIIAPYIQGTITGGCLSSISAGYKGAIRQDIAGRKVYIIPPGTSAEQLLYDFNMEVGDSVKGYLESFNGKDVVESIDSVFTGSRYLRRWYINHCYHIYFIEGIGSTYGLVEVSPGCITDLWDIEITCFQQNGQTQYPDTAMDCKLITSINSKEKNPNPVKVFPNPSNGNFTVQFEEPMSIREIRLTGLPGNEILHQQINRESKINIGDLPAGIYFLTITGKDDRTTTMKIIRN
jgi:hypothetical protein